MFQEGEGHPVEETGKYKERDVVPKGTVEKPPQESWWKRTFGIGKTPDKVISLGGPEKEIPSSGPDGLAHHHEKDVVKINPVRAAKETEEREYVNRKYQREARELQRQRDEEFRAKRDAGSSLSRETPPDSNKTPKIEDEPGL